MCVYDLLTITKESQNGMITSHKCHISSRHHQMLLLNTYDLVLIIIICKNKMNGEERCVCCVCACVEKMSSFTFVYSLFGV